MKTDVKICTPLFYFPEPPKNLKIEEKWMIFHCSFIRLHLHFIVYTLSRQSLWSSLYLKSTIYNFQPSSFGTFIIKDDICSCGILKLKLKSFNPFKYLMSFNWYKTNIIQNHWMYYYFHRQFGFFMNIYVTIFLYKVRVNKRFVRKSKA